MAVEVVIAPLSTVFSIVLFTNVTLYMTILGSGLIAQSQKMTAAAMQIAEK
jgi:hypothetical protein